MSTDSVTTPAQLSGADIHRALQRPDVRAVFDEMMQLKSDLPHAGTRYHECHDRLQIVAADWFRLSRDAAKEKEHAD
ncbi:MAG TPA: hypothetical protein VKQ30_25445 [Ktedonobacterales bacterium]|nr:hypothetical protein [Ktedonobacterales bacterium]